MNKRLKNISNDELDELMEDFDEDETPVVVRPKRRRKDIAMDEDTIQAGWADGSPSYMKWCLDKWQILKD